MGGQTSKCWREIYCCNVKNQGVGVDGSQQHYQELLGNIYETMLADVADC
jgi:hypothetical protein